MGKLYEVLAVEKDVKNTASKIIQETAKTFTDKQSHFIEQRKEYKAINEEDKDIPTGEYHPMVTTVKDKLDYTENTIVRLLDVILQKERANQLAKADLEVEKPDGTKTTLLKDVPVTVLVQFETILADLRDQVYNRIPTNDPARTWKKDSGRPNVFVADPVMTVRTKKVNEVIVMYPATDKHPAQTQLVQVDKNVGNWITSTSSGAMSPKQKSDLLDRIDRIIAGVKIARAKANDCLVEDAHIGKTLFRFINEALSD